MQIFPQRVTFLVDARSALTFLTRAPALLVRRQKVRRTIATCCFLLILFGAPSLSTSSEASPESGERSFTDYWNDFQTYMNDKGVILQTINTLDFLGNTSGGLRRKTAVAGDLDLLLILDGERFSRLE